MKHEQRTRRRPGATIMPIERLEERQLLTVFTVTNTNDSGAGSLRWALDQSNNTAGVDTIAFNITAASKVIHVASQLPAVYDPGIVDGTTQPGYAGKPLVQIDGTGTASSVDGLKLFGNSAVRGLSVTGFGGSGITTVVNATPNLIEKNWVGIDLNGNAAGNKAHGVGVFTPGNTVQYNVVSSNGADGIFVMGGLFGNDARGNTVQYNLVGTDPTGNLARANAANGIATQASPGNWILNNVSSANGNDGILLTGAQCANEVVKGNIVGLNSAGAAALGNQWYGIEISGPNNTIGGTTAADRNVVAASLLAGIVFYTSSCYGNVCQGNYVGTDITGTKGFGNHQQGLAFASAGANQIGGLSTGQGNIVAASYGVGVGIFPGNGEVVQGNRFGAGSDGRALPNLGGDVFVSSDSNSNVISNNTGPTNTTPPPASPVLQSAVSRKTQGGTSYDITLPLTGTSGVECRQASSGLKIVFTFDKAIQSATAAVTAGAATVNGAAVASGSTVTVTLTGVGNAQSVTLTLSNIVAGDGSTLTSAAVTFRTLLGDVNGNGTVSASDVSAIKASIGGTVSASTFRCDLSANGAISASDVNLCKAAVGGVVSALTAAIAVQPTVQVVTTDNAVNPLLA